MKKRIVKIGRTDAHYLSLKRKDSYAKEFIGKTGTASKIKNITRDGYCSCEFIFDAPRRVSPTIFASVKLEDIE